MAVAKIASIIAKKRAADIAKKKVAKKTAKKKVAKKSGMLGIVFFLTIIHQE